MVPLNGALTSRKSKKPGFSRLFAVPETGLEPALPLPGTRPSTWRVCQFHHSGSKALFTLRRPPTPKQALFTPQAPFFPLLVTQRFDRVQQGGTPGRIPAKDHANHHR